MSDLQTFELSPAGLRPGDTLPYWQQRVVTAISRGDFGQINVYAKGKAPLVLDPRVRVTAYREREAA